jgi:GNAT superfamily N-acetyltransferase
LLGEGLTMVTYQVEKWRDALPEMEPILVQHWHEIALGHDKVPLDIGRDKYQELCDSGVLQVITARDSGALVGYHVAMVTPHLHYMSTPHCITDVYFVQPEYRKGFTGIRLLKKVEEEAKARGVKKLITGTKLHLDMGRVFERLGYTETERTYTKYIGE